MIFPLYLGDVFSDVVPADETAAWASDIDVSLKISVFLLTLVAYDAGAQASTQSSFMGAM